MRSSLPDANFKIWSDPIFSRFQDRRPVWSRCCAFRDSQDSSTALHKENESNVMDFAPSFTLDVDPSSLAHAPEPTRNYSSFNPSLLVDNDSVLVYFRVSNMHFCGSSASWRENMFLQTHLRSFLGHVKLDRQSWQPLSPAVVLRSATSLFRSGDACFHRVDLGGGSSGTFSGPEDPRPVWSTGTMPRTPWLLVSAWSEDCTRLRPHLIKLNAAGGGGGGGGGDGGGGVGGGGYDPRQLPLVVSEWPSESNVEHPESQLLQKNWVPFSHEGSLLAEYSIEPHVVLRIDPESGRCAPVLPRGIATSAHGAMGGSEATFPSFTPLARIAAEYGRLSGGVPPLHLPSHHVYLGYCHTKASRSMPQYLGTSSMVYKHLFYAFEEAPPFAVIAAGPLHTLPEPPSRAERTMPTVQFAAGMIHDEATGDLVISYSTMDCGAHLTRVPMESVLRATGLVW